MNVTKLRNAWAAVGVPDQGYSDTQKEQILGFLASLESMSDDDLRKETEQYIWLSAYANNNPGSAYHPMCDATHDEWKRRGNVEAYSEAHKAVMRSCGYDS